MNEEQIKDYIEAHTPEWLGRCHVVVRDGAAHENWLVQVFVDFTETEWVKINGDGDIDVSERLRCDWEFAKDHTDEVGMEHTVAAMFTQMEVDFADLALTPAHGGLERDPLLNTMKDGARLLPRDLVRRLIKLDANYLARKVAEESSFREEDWFKEWGEDVKSQVKEAAPGVELELPGSSKDQD